MGRLAGGNLCKCRDRGGGGLRVGERGTAIPTAAPSDGREVPLDAPAQYVSWNFVLISIPNIVIILLMIVVFVLALLAPFPHGESGRSGHGDGDGRE